MILGDHAVGQYVPSGPMSGATTVPGVYVAGNVADPMAQVIELPSPASGPGPRSTPTW